MSCHLQFFRQSVPVHLLLPIYLLRGLCPAAFVCLSVGSLSCSYLSVLGHLVLSICWQPVLFRPMPGLVLLSFCWQPVLFLSVSGQLLLSTRWQPVLFLSVCVQSSGSVYLLATCPVPVCLCPVTCFCLHAGNLSCSCLSVSGHLLLSTCWQLVLFLSVCVRSPASVYTLAPCPVPVCLCPVTCFCLHAGTLSFS